MVSQKLLDELKRIIQEDYSIQLEEQAVADIGNTLVSFFETLARIENENEYENENFRSTNS